MAHVAGHEDKPLRHGGGGKKSVWRANLAALALKVGGQFRSAQAYGLGDGQPFGDRQRQRFQA